MTGENEVRLQSIREFLESHGVYPGALQRICQALTHRSYAFEHGELPDNERLEFLGDAVVGCEVSRFLFMHFPDAPEGELSKRKAFIVSRLELGYRAREMHLDDLLLLGHGEESSGGRRRLSILGSALEALVGALHLEAEPEEVRQFIHSTILEPALPLLFEHAMDNAKSELQEYLQARGEPLPRYVKVGQEGPDHNRRFVVEVHAAGHAIGRGEGQRIKIAENRAAREALRNLVKPERKAESGDYAS